MTEPRTQLPLDILGYIVELLASDRDTKSLQTLSQTCRYMLPLCRKHLFTTVKLCRRLRPRLSDLLSPGLVRYVKTLIYPVDTFTDHDLKILDMLKNHSPSLQSIELLTYGRINWDKLPESIKLSLELLIQLPSVTHLDISSFKGFPSTALALCSNLKDLQLEDLDIAPPDAGRGITRSKIPTPASLSVKTRSYNGLAVLMASVDPGTVSPIIDFSRLHEAFFYLESTDDIVQICQLIKTAHIQSLYINLHWPVRLAGIGQSLTVNAYRSLTSLAVRIGAVRQAYHDPLCGLTGELRSIAKNNILEEFKLYIVLEANASCNTASDDWSAFDSVLTDSGAFPMLHRVLVNIWWYSEVVIAVGEVNALMNSLTKGRFPRLVEKPAVEFTFRAAYHDSPYLNER